MEVRIFFSRFLNNCNNSKSNDRCCNGLFFLKRRSRSPRQITYFGRGIPLLCGASMFYSQVLIY